MKVLILGAGNMGRAIAYLLQSIDDYEITLADLSLPDIQNKEIKTIQCDIQNETALDALLKSRSFDAVISCLPYYCNVIIAKKAKQYGLHYFDLTEDVKTTESIEKIAQNAKTVFMPHCGLAPGFINIAASHFIAQFDQVDSVLLRAGALPQNSNNALHYALTWSTDGLINEYGNLCEAIVDGQYRLINPLEEIETLILDGVTYECFNTSGGLGTLTKSYRNKVNNMNYKTIRYPGHAEKIKFLMKDLHFNQHRSELKSILEETLPKTDQDVVIVYIAVTGRKNNQFSEENYTKKFYPAVIAEQKFTALQLSTASSACAVVDMILTKNGEYAGFVKQEQLRFSKFLQNRFGKYYE